MCVFNSSHLDFCGRLRAIALSLRLHSVPLFFPDVSMSVLCRNTACSGFWTDHYQSGRKNINNLSPNLQKGPELGLLKDAGSCTTWMNFRHLHSFHITTLLFHSHCVKPFHKMGFSPMLSRHSHSPLRLNMYPVLIPFLIKLFTVVWL